MRGGHSFVRVPVVDSLQKFLKVLGQLGLVGGLAASAVLATLAFGREANFLEPLFQMMLVGSVCMAATGGWVWLASARQVRREREARLETQFLQVVRRKHGRITDVELAAESGESIETSRKFLERMAREGSAELEVAPEGRFFYEFAGFLSAVERERRTNKDDLLRRIEETRRGVTEDSSEGGAGSERDGGSAPKATEETEA